MTIELALDRMNQILEYKRLGMSEYEIALDTKSLKIAIASLEAWEAVRQEINDLFSKPACYMPNYDAYKMFLEIIDKHIKEVEE